MTPVSPFHRVLPWLLGGFAVGALLWVLETGGEVWRTWEPPEEVATNAPAGDGRPQPGVPERDAFGGARTTRLRDAPRSDAFRDRRVPEPPADDVAPPVEDAPPVEVAPPVSEPEPPVAAAAPDPVPVVTEPEPGLVDARPAEEEPPGSEVAATPSDVTPDPAPRPPRAVVRTPSPTPRDAGPPEGWQRPDLAAATFLPLDLPSAPPAPPTAPTRGQLVVRSEVEPPNGRIALAVVRLVPRRPHVWDPHGTTLHVGPQQGEPWVETGDPVPPDEVTSRAWNWDALPPGFWRLVALPDSAVAPARSVPLRVRANHTNRTTVEWTLNGGIEAVLELPDASRARGVDVRLWGPLPDGFNVAHADPQDLIGATSVHRTTDTRGVFEVRGLTPGARYLAHAWTPDGRRATAEMTAGTLPPRLTRWTLEPPVAVEVTVRDGRSGRPMGGRVLDVVDHVRSALSGVPREGSRPLRRSRPTDPEGRAVLPVEPGAWVVADFPGFAAGAVCVTPDVAEAGRAVLDLWPPEPGVLRVVDAEGRPVQNAVVDATWHGTERGLRRTGMLHEGLSDAAGRVVVAELGDVPTLDAGSLSLRARHVRAGVASLELDLADLDGSAALPPTLVLRPAGTIVVQFATSGWPPPPPRELGRRWNITDLGQLDPGSFTLDLELRYLGNAGPFAGESAGQGARRRVLVSVDDEHPPTARFDDLEPGVYTIAMTSRTRDFACTTPALRVFPGRTTEHFVAPDHPALFAEVTVDLGSAVLTGVADPPEVALEREDGMVPRVLGAGILPPIAGEDAVRRQPLVVGGRAVFRSLPPGRFVVRTLLPDASAPSGWREHVSQPFDVVPGEDVLIQDVDPVDAGPSGDG